MPIRVPKAPRYSNHHNNLTTQLHGLKTTLSTSTSMLALSQIDSLDRVPSLEVHTSDEEESEEDTKEEYSTNTSFSTTRNNNHEMHLEQVIKEKNAHENRLKKLKKLDKQLTQHFINKHDPSLTCFGTNPESQTLAPFTKPTNRLGTHPSQHDQTPILSLDDIHNGVLNEVHQKHKISLNQIKEVKQQLEDKQQIIESMQQKVDQDKATIQNLKDEIKDLKRKAKEPTTNRPNSPNIITHVLALLAGIMVGIAIDKYVSKAEYEEKEERSVSDKQDSSV